ncbi:F-box domain-protein [Podospora conica]|nr:F-box domain-protein [Schizothecium conicum]
MDSTNPAVEIPSVTQQHQGKDDQPGALAELTKQTIERPLTFLKLPKDILELILDEITYTDEPNLTSLALTNSALYNLVVPRIYESFTFVWPNDDDNDLYGTVSPSTSRASTVSKQLDDSFTCGLQTLALGSRFASSTRKAYLLGHPNNNPKSLGRIDANGNNCAHHIKFFAVRNSSPRWVANHLIAEESGRLLGALVALAVAKMKNLESFVWDSPTGVLSGVFMALSSLGDQPDRECKLSTVWIRCHDNEADPDERRPRAAANLRFGAQTSPLPAGSEWTPIGIRIPANAPPLRPTFPFTLTALDIDELEYLDELAILIERSRDVLKELRDGPDLKQRDVSARWPGASTIGQRRLGGVLGVIFSGVYDIRKQQGLLDERAPQPPSTNPSGGFSKEVQAPSPLEVDQPSSSGKRNPNGQLGLEVLELERVSLSIHVLRYAINWSILQHLTLLDCHQHEDLWKMLHAEFRPTRTSTGRQYHLALTNIHTDFTTEALVDFLRDTLKPNTLEVLVLQDRRCGIGAAAVSVDLICDAIKKHRESLQILLLDSSARHGDAGRWLSWCPTTAMINWLTSGRMTSLEQLSVCLHYKDWHLLLQRLPNMPALNILNIPQIADHPTRNYDDKDMVQQIVNIIALQPKIRLYIVGMGPKCFEIRDVRPPDKSTPTPDLWNDAPSPDGVGAPGAAAEVVTWSDDEGNLSGDDWEDEDQDDDAPATSTSNGDEESEDLEEDVSENTDVFVEPLEGFQQELIEIEFSEAIYIFKARSCRL